MTEPEGASYHTRTGRADYRIGAILGSALLIVVGIGAAMGASPASSSGATTADASASPAATSSAGATSSPNASNAPSGRDGGWKAGRVGGFGPFGGRGKLSFGDGLAGARFGPITITAVDGSNVSLKTEDGWTRTIEVTGDTTITKGGATISVGGLKVGDAIRFAQRRNQDGSFTITAVNVIVPQRAGTVTDLTSDGFTIEGRAGIMTTVTVSGDTTYSIAGGSATKSDVVVGATVVVAGAVSGSAFDASSVTIILPRIVGQVTAKTDSTITITRADGTTATLNVGGGTTYVGPDGASLSNVAVGSVIAAEVRQKTNNTFDAVRVLIGGNRGKGQGPAFGLPSARGVPHGNPNATPAPSASGSTTG